jgi:hypothetical protein
MTTTITRRHLLRASAVGGGILLAGGGAGLAGPLGRDTAAGASRVSRLHARERLAHADLHNHSHLSDGSGDPALAFESMRRAGLDIAALTDHSTISFGAGAIVDVCGTEDVAHGERGRCQSRAGLTEEGWVRTAELADAANEPGDFVALRGFEWSDPHLGHVNVWFSQRWIDPLHTVGGRMDDLGTGSHANLPGIDERAGAILDAAARRDPREVGIGPFYEWLRSQPEAEVLGGGLDGLAGFNHPGREPGRFSRFHYEPAVAPQFVSLEIFNRHGDFLFQGLRKGQPSPLVECLNAGWRVGLAGVSDEHGPEWGVEGKGRTGLWVKQLDRAGVRESMEARRFFATRRAGLRVDATIRPHTGEALGTTAQADIPAVTRMGSTMHHPGGAVVVDVDVDLGDESAAGLPIEVQVLRPGDEVPAVVHVEQTRVPAPDQGAISFVVDLNPADGDWVVLRIADPAMPNQQPGPEGHPCNNFALAYTSPFWLET